MRIVHALFSDVHGGLEQAYVDYTEALALSGHQITALMHPKAPFAGQVKSFASDIFWLKPLGFYDPFSVMKLAKTLKETRPDVILAHNGRAITIAMRAAKSFGITVIGVSHSYKTKHCSKADGLLVLTEHMREHFIAAGYDAGKIAVQKNMIRIPDATPWSGQFRDPLVIGALGRLVEEKGFDVLLNSLAILKSQGVAFKLRLAGDGSSKEKLLQLSHQLGIHDRIDWTGWITDKSAFYRSVDMVILPSVYEPFGLVVLEAMAHGVPVIASNLPGPAQMIHDQIHGLLVPPGDAKALATAIQQNISQPAKALEMAGNGLQKATGYSLEAGAAALDKNIRMLVTSVRMPKAA